MARTAKQWHRDGFFTRSELTTRWKCSSRWIMKLIERGALVEEPRDADAHARTPHYYTEEAVRRAESLGYATIKTSMKHRRLIGAQLRAFQLFKEGKDLVDVVLILGVDPKIVDDLYRMYMNRNLEERYRDREIRRAAGLDPDGDS